jgi:hypothetical protein
MSMARAEVSAEAIAAARAAGDAGLTTITGTVTDMLADGAGKTGELFSRFFGGVMGQAQKAIADEATAATYLAGFVKEGETADKTLARLSTSLTTVNATWEALGFTLEAFTLAGGGAASTFADLMGGLESFKEATAGYYAHFYSEDERAAFAAEKLSAKFANLGKTMPDTSAGFRALVDAAEAAGDDALLAGLLKLAGAFSGLVPSADAAAAEATKRVKAQEGAALSELERTADRQRDILLRNIDGWQALVSEVGGVADWLSSTVADVRQSALTPALAGAAGQAQLSSMLSAALATGALPDQAGLEQAVSAVRAGINAAGAYGNATDRSFASLALAGGSCQAICRERSQSQGVFLSAMSSVGVSGLR